LRVGTFQYAAIQKNIKILKTLVSYALQRHFPHLKDEKNTAISLLKIVIEKQTELVSKWMGVGFIHGVMNTDNMTISGETIDYGPCAFMDAYDPETVFSSIDLHGRYSYFNQPGITKWNLTRFAETLIPLIHEKEESAIQIAKEIINNFSKLYTQNWLLVMRKKIGLFGEKDQDINLVEDLLSFMQKNKLDYTNTFCSLMKSDVKKEKIFEKKDFIDWYTKWTIRLAQNNKPLKLSLNLMKQNNPLVIPRNHKVEESLEAASNNGNLKPLHDLLNYVKKPYIYQKGISDYQKIPLSNGNVYKTFCGT
jgi:serine/tyrosine/threonine adenylyltransferase